MRRELALLLLGVLWSGLFLHDTTAAARKSNSNKGKRGAELPANVEMLPISRREAGVQNLRLLPVNAVKSSKPLASATLDRLMVEEFIKEGMERALPKAADDIFFRRVHFALVGRSPQPHEILSYLEDTSEDKKRRLINDLLDRQEFGQHQARYWRDVINYRLPEGATVVASDAFEKWLAEQFNNNVSWAQIVGEMVSATGISDEKPSTYMIVAHEGDPVQLAGEVSRIFMGIQIQCAECHHHPSDTWKREQFHELASFFGKVRVKNRPDLQSQNRRYVYEVFQTKSNYHMPDLQDPSSTGTVMEPVFLTGQAIPNEIDDLQRRYVFGRLMTSQRNEYFARAFVNRVWAQLFGYGFTNPVDNIGNNVPVAYPRVFDAVADSFRATGFDVKELYRLILNTKTFERRFQAIDGSFGEDIMFAAIQPSRLSSDQIFDNLQSCLGDLEKDKPTYRPGLREDFREAFGVDPSADRDEIDASILQALILMNSPAIHAKINANDPKNLLHYLLSEYKTDAEAIEHLYLHVLSRKPRESEVRECLNYLSEIPDRKEAFEDILWCLINTTEFLHNQ